MQNWVLLAQLLSALFLLNGKQNSRNFFYCCNIGKRFGLFCYGGVRDTFDC